MSDIVKCKQCGKHMSKFNLKQGVCKSCTENNTNYWAQFKTEE